MPTDGYIKRDDAINALKVSAILRNLDSVEDGTAHRYKRAAERIIAGVPAADVEPVRHGRWIRVEWVKDEDWQEGGYWILRCSECVMPYHNPTPHCPHCGAKMDAEPPKEGDNE